MSKQVHGRVCHMSEGRWAFVGKTELRPDTLYLEFMNQHSERTRLTLSHEAARALYWLLEGALDGDVRRCPEVEPRAYTILRQVPEPMWTAVEEPPARPAAND